MSRFWFHIVVMTCAGCVAEAGPGEVAGPRIECQSDAICDDGLACTTDRCDESLHCVHEPVGRACPVDGQCLDCALLDDASACVRGVCEPGVGCAAAPADEGEICAPASCTGGSAMGTGTCDADGTCVLPDAESCVSDEAACAWAFCDPQGERCVRLPALTAACQLGGEDEPEIWRGIELRKATTDPSSDDWEIRQRNIAFHQGAISLSTFVDSQGEDWSDVEPNLVERTPGQFELRYPNHTFQVALTSGADVLAGHPRARSGLTVLLRPPAAPLAPDALTGRWFVVLAWLGPAWHPAILKTQVGELQTWFGEMDLIGADDRACTRLGDTIRGVRGELRTLSGSCASVAPDGTWSADLEVTFDGGGGHRADLALEGVLGAGADLAVARLGSSFEGQAVEPLRHGVVIMVRVREQSAPLEGHYAVTLSEQTHHHRGVLEFTRSTIAGGTLDRLKPEGCDDARKLLRVLPTADTGFDGLYDLWLVPQEGDPPFLADDQHRLWFTLAPLPGDPALGGATPMAIGSVVQQANVFDGALTPSLQGPALVVWQPPGAAPMAAPFTADPDTWCLP